MTTLFTSDTHFGHANIIGYTNRPFDNISSMDTTLINNWNRIVKKGDIVYHLGDFGFKSWRSIGSVRERLNGEIVIVRGNHDPSEGTLKKAGFKHIHKYMEISFNNMSCFLGHVPMVSKYHDVVICGHVHCQFHINGNIVNVGVDMNVYQPVPLRIIAKWYQDGLFDYRKVQYYISEVDNAKT